MDDWQRKIDRIFNNDLRLLYGNAWSTKKIIFHQSQQTSSNTKIIKKEKIMCINIFHLHTENMHR